MSFYFFSKISVFSPISNLSFQHNPYSFRPCVGKHQHAVGKSDNRECTDAVIYARCSPRDEIIASSSSSSSQTSVQTFARHGTRLAGRA